MQQRQSGLDLIRVTGFFLVTLFHAFLYNGYYGQPQVGFAMWSAGVARSLSMACNGLFMTLSGYLHYGKRSLSGAVRGLGPVLLGYALAAAFSIPVRHFLLGQQESFSVWVTRFFGFRGVYYGWYVEMYIGLALLSPFLNRLLEVLPDRELCLLTLVLLFLTAVPGATPMVLAPAYWVSAYPLLYYVLGAAIRRFQPKIPTWAGLTGALGIAVILGTCTVLSTDGNLDDALIWQFGDLWVAGMVVCLFLALYRLRPGKALSKLLTFGAGGCFGGYLLSNLPDARCYQACPWHDPKDYWKQVLFVTVPIWLCSMAAGHGLEALCRRICRRKNIFEKVEKTS